MKPPRHLLPCLLLVLCFASGCRNPAHDNMEVMFKRAQKQFSPAELQNAVASVCTSNDSDYVPVQNLPREILALSDDKPFVAWVSINGRGKGTLVVLWGGEMTSWGVGVCPPGGVLDTNLEAHVLRWGDGVFFFYEPPKK